MTALFGLLLLALPSPSFAARAVMEETQTLGNTVYVATNTSRFGIQTSTPLAPLDVRGGNAQGIGAIFVSSGDATISSATVVFASTGQYTQSIVCLSTDPVNGCTGPNNVQLFYDPVARAGGLATQGRPTIFGNSTGVGVGKANPASKLDVAGTATMTGFKMGTGASNGYVLTSDGSGNGTWSAAQAGPTLGSTQTWSGQNTFQSTATLFSPSLTSSTQTALLGICPSGCTTTATSFTPAVTLTGSTVTLNTSGQDILVNFTGELSNTSGVVEDGCIGLLLDGVLYRSGAIFCQSVPITAGANQASAGFAAVLKNLAPGAHTLSVAWATNGGNTMTMQAGFPILTASRLP